MDVIKKLNLSINHSDKRTETNILHTVLSQQQPLVAVLISTLWQSYIHIYYIYSIYIIYICVYIYWIDPNCVTVLITP